MKYRNLFLDLVKGVTIFFVIWGHCIQYGTEFTLTQSYFDNKLFQFIYSFHMPLFMLISGYFFYPSTQKFSINENLKKKINHIVIPAISGGIVYFIIFNIKNFANPNYIALIRSFIHNTAFSVWFLWAVFNSGLIILLNQKLFKDNIISYFFLIILSLCLPNIFNFNLYTYMFPYFLVGYLWNKNGLSKYVLHYFSKFTICKTLIITILFLLALQFYSKEDFIYTSGTFILQNEYPFLNLNQLSINIYRYFIGFLGSASILSIIYQIKNLKIFNINNSFTSFLLLIGQNTLGLYIFSGFINQFLYILQTNYFKIESFNYILSLLEATFILVISMKLITLISKNQLLKKLLLGK